MAQKAAQSLIDAHGHVWSDGQGKRMTAADHLAALTGVRNRTTLFESGPRADLPAAQHRAMLGDPDSGERGHVMPAAHAAMRSVLDDADGGHARDRSSWLAERERRTEQVRNRHGGRVPVRQGDGESTRDRSERMRRPVHLEQVDGSGLAGAQPQYAPGGTL
jgi:hypothetical protein